MPNTNKPRKYNLLNPSQDYSTNAKTPMKGKDTVKRTKGKDKEGRQLRSKEPSKKLRGSFYLAKTTENVFEVRNPEKSRLCDGLL